MVLFLDRALWVWVDPSVTMARLITIEDSIGPVMRARILSLIRDRLGLDEDAA